MKNRKYVKKLDEILRLLLKIFLKNQHHLVG
jgi:hypothetical protein